MLKIFCFGRPCPHHLPSSSLPDPAGKLFGVALKTIRRMVSIITLVLNLAYQMACRYILEKTFIFWNECLSFRNECRIFWNYQYFKTEYGIKDRGVSGWLR